MVLGVRTKTEAKKTKEEEERGIGEWVERGKTGKVLIMITTNHHSSAD